MGKNSDEDYELIDDIEQIDLEEEGVVLPPPPPEEAKQERGEFEGWELGEEDLT